MYTKGSKFKKLRSKVTQMKSKVISFHRAYIDTEVHGKDALALHEYIVACQRGGVSNDPLVHNHLDKKEVLWISMKNFKSTNRIPDSPYFY